LKTTSINLNGLELLSDDYSFQVVGLFDFEKDIITNDLFSDGQSFNRSKIKSKTITLQGFIKNWNFQSVINLNAALAGNGLKTLTVNILEFNTPVTLQVEITSRAAADDTNSKKIVIICTAPDPFMYAVNAVSILLGATSNNSLTFPLTFPIIFGAYTGGEGIILNSGTTIAYPVITIAGACSNITIKNNTTAESMSINVTLLDSDTLIIDNRPATRGVYLNGAGRMDLKSGSWISCAIGNNNFVFSRNTLETSTRHCTVSLQSRWN